MFSALILASLFSASSLNCPTTILENRTNTWTKQDHDNLMFSKKRCGEIYKDSPCLKFFRKKAKLTYHAVCGSEE